MIIKKYQAKTESEAVEQAKKELGQNVVVMNVHTMKKKGFFQFLKPKMIEITAALEEDADKELTRREAQQNVSRAQGQFTAGNTAMTRNAAAAANTPGGDPQESRIAEDGILPRSLVESTMSQRQSGGDAISRRLDNLQTLLEMQLRPAEEEKEKDKQETEEPEEKSETVAFMQLLYNTMIENEVNEKYANQIIDEIEKNNKTNTPIDHILANVYQKMILKFGKPLIIQPAKAGPKVVFFIGPTGVGKTTTIAKIASKFRVDEKKKIALLTADTYRIAAAEQLRTYANILEVPFRVIYSVEEMETAFLDFAEYDYIFVDTAGHSHRNETQRENMNEFIHSVDKEAEKEVFLVLSATTKYKDLLNIADAYHDMTDYKLIFTKLDETTTLGNLLNLKLHTGAALSYVTYGQNVPDDIEQFNPQKTVKQLLGGKR
ncbi:MAG: flagellar biosynthesis protein FlhF [Lachnospiraceae bacterium]|nr:flagellar biosynthesis protein FlhF [Lachnospiraceae bacterium]